jgi:AcrR family transcriptional regulator
VHEAVSELLRERDARDVTIAAVAERSGVHQATIYRRWGSVPALIEEVVTELLSVVSPVPDTGSLRGDLERYATKVADDLANPIAAAYLKAFLGGETSAGASPPAFEERTQQLQGMLDRASERGEAAPRVDELFDVLLVPMYFHLLARRKAPTHEYAVRLVERLLALPRAKSVVDHA